MPYLDHIEWEYLQNKQTYDLALFSLSRNYNLPNIKEIYVKRDKTYNHWKYYWKV